MTAAPTKPKTRPKDPGPYKLADLGWGTPELRGLTAKERMAARAVWTGEKRAPRKGEWYLSGAIPEAYYMPNDGLTTEYFILKLVRVETKTVVTETIIGDL